jgi:acetyltransferase-like isoleucine patch superfamily enzyme
MVDVMKQGLERQFPKVKFGHRVQLPALHGLEIGMGSCIADDVWLNDCHEDGTVRIRIGMSVLVGRRGVISAASPIEIGNYCLFAPNVYVSNVDHDYAGIETAPIFMNGIVDKGPLVIEENCWLGINAVVNGGVTVGRGSVIGANAVVNRSIPPFSVAVGAPARVVKMLDFSDGTWKPVRSPAEAEEIAARREPLMPGRNAFRMQLDRQGPFPIADFAAGALGAEIG